MTFQNSTLNKSTGGIGAANRGSWTTGDYLLIRRQGVTATQVTSIIRISVSFITYHNKWTWTVCITIANIINHNESQGCLRKNCQNNGFNCLIKRKYFPTILLLLKVVYLSVLKLPYKKLVLLQTTYLESGKMGPNSVMHGMVFTKWQIWFCFLSCKEVVT